MTEFSGQPLFGKDSSPHHTSKILAFIGTCICWVIFLVCMILIKPAEKAPKYKEVQIVLESAPVVKEEVKNPPKEVERQESTSNKVQQENKVEKDIVDKTVKTPVPVAKTETKPIAESKPVAKKTESQQTTQQTESWDDWDDFDYALDPMEAFAQQTAKTPKKEVDWDNMFGEENTAVSSDSENSKVIGGNSFGGVAGVTSQNNNTKVKSSQIENNKENWQVSGATSDLLGEISNTKYVSSTVNGISSETKIESSRTGDGKVYIKMSNGRTRALIKPASPAITLSKEASALIDTSKTVKIRFMVMKKGTVPETQIEIKPAALLPEMVQQEIKAQISQWVFESDNYDAFAEFEYNIVKK